MGLCTFIYHGEIWAAEFKRGRKSLGGDEGSGRPETAITDENIAKIHQMVFRRPPN